MLTTTRSKSGHHETDYNEQVAPAVQNETVVAKQHEQQTTAVDKQRPQDHYHTTVQPVKHQEVLPEQHHHNVAGVEHRSFEHGDDGQVKSRLEQEQSQFRDTSQRVDGERTTAAAPTVTGEHVHHHVHETVQPVVQKQTIEPHVVHTTVPIHETHHDAAQHHEATALPPVSMDEFKKQGGALNGTEARRDKVTQPFSTLPRHTTWTNKMQFDGCPPEHGERGVDGRCGHPSHRDGAAITPTKPTPIHDKMTTSAKPTDNGHNTTTTARPTTNIATDRSDPSLASSGNNMHNKPVETRKKPSLMDKINPKKDADGDGKAGFMK